jgi:hypothetical protein
MHAAAQQANGDFCLGVEQPEALGNACRIGDFDQVARLGLGIEITQLAAKQEWVPDGTFGHDLWQWTIIFRADVSLGQSFKFGIG